MGDAPEMRQYKVGDQVRMRLELEHEMNLDAVFLLYEHETAKGLVVTLEAEQFLPGGDIRSEVELSAVIRPHHTPGVYNLLRANLLTTSHRYFRLQDEENLGMVPERSFRVVEEPSSSPRIASATPLY